MSAPSAQPEPVQSASEKAGPPPAGSPQSLSICADDNRPGLTAREILGELRLDGAQSSDAARAEASRLNREGARLANSGRLDEALLLHRRALRADPRSIEAVYELAYGYFARREPLVTADLLRGTADALGPLAYELLGNAYDAAGDETCALMTYRKGLDRFPRAGQLWVELGLLAERKHRVGDALELWEKGIIAEPTNASSYHRAGPLLLRTSARLWGLLYLEIAINLEPGSARSANAGALLERAYLEALGPGGSGLGEYGAPQQGQQNWNAFEELWRRAMTSAVARIGGPVRNAQAVADVRRAFVDAWAAVQARPANPLWERQRALVDAGLWETYNVWLFRGAGGGAWEAFRQANPAQAEALSEWLRQHPLQLDDHSHMSRLRTMTEFLKVQSQPSPETGRGGGAALNGGRPAPTWF